MARAVWRTMECRRHERIVGELRAEIERVERSGRKPRACLPFGIPALDKRLPGGGLALGALHEVCGAGPELAHTAAAALFLAGALARLKGPVLWCLPRRDLFGPALAGAGLHPDRVIFAEGGDEATVFAVAEEALRQPGLAGVVVETTRLGPTSSRRLQLAAEGSGVVGLVLRRWCRREDPPAGSTVSTTRWRVAALPSASLGMTPGVGRPRWRIELARCRGGEAPFEWVVEACDGQGRLRLSPDLANRPAAPASARRSAG